MRVCVCVPSAVGRYSFLLTLGNVAGNGSLCVYFQQHPTKTEMEGGIWQMCLLVGGGRDRGEREREDSLAAG